MYSFIPPISEGWFIASILLALLAGIAMGFILASVFASGRREDDCRQCRYVAAYNAMVALKEGWKPKNEWLSDSAKGFKGGSA